MTSSTTTAQETTDSRSVRDIVEHAHDQVNETWCRRIFRQLLQSLERQYAMEMPHRVITPDTVVFHENGDPLLLPSVVDDPAPGPADDLTALAKLVHYAITQELLPAGPLHGRDLQGYSDSLKTAVDRCMDPDPARRPQSIDELRDILGIVAPGSIPPAPPPPLADDPVAQPAASPAPTAASEPVPAAAQAQTMRASASGTQASAPATVAPDASSHPARKRWPLVAGAVIVLAIVLAGLAALRNGDQDKESDSAYNTAPPAAAPATEPGTQAAADNAPAASPTAAQPPETPVTSTATAAADPGQSAPSRDAVTVPATTPPAVPPAQAPATNATGATGATNATNNSVSYRLQIQPWGTVYVDGVDRGVSPPVKRLVLAPGRHTIRVANPNFRERVLEIDTASGDGRIAVDFSSAE